MAIFKKLHKRTGVEFYYIRFHLGGGKWRKEKAGTTKTQAGDLLKKRLGQVASGTYVDPRKKTAAEDIGPTFSEFSERFKKDYAGQRRSNHYAQRLKPLIAHFRNRPLKELRRVDFDMYRAIRGRRVGPSTLRKELTVLGTVFRKAVEWDVLEASPAVNLEKPREPSHRTRYLNRDEWGRLLAGAPLWLKPIVTLAVVSGMRLKELLNVQWEDWDREAGLLHVSEDNKTERARVIPLSEAAVAVLKSQVRRLHASHVFVNRQGRPYLSRDARQFIARRTRSVMKAVGIEGASFHTLRHTTGSWLAQAGESEVKIAKMLGHASARTTERYMHLEPEHLRGAALKLDEALRAPVPQAAPHSDNSEKPLEPIPQQASGGTLTAVRP